MPGTQIFTEGQFELIDLVSESDSVEMKLTIPNSARRAAIEALNIDPLDAQIRQVFFFDTPDLTLNNAGVVVRARRVQGKGDDSVVKLRPVVPGQLPAELRASPNFVVEVDVMPTGYVCSGSLKGAPPAPGVRESLRSGLPIRKLFSKEQRAFYKEHAPEGLELDDLSVLGPIFVLKVKAPAEGLPGKVVGELWLYPDGSIILELSTKCTPAEAGKTALEVRKRLGKHGLDTSTDQQTKTKTALEFFSAQLRDQAGADG
jgi:hypothetical protein